jgi:beta-fructofuranosidase
MMLTSEHLETRHLEAIRKAQESIDLLAVGVSHDPHRLAYHFISPSCWINDPNGMIYFREEYHLFYQIHPFSAQNGLKHWGHAKSRDLVHWEHLPIALAPTEEFERNGCFSGSAVDNNGTMTIIYTGNVNGPEKVQVQCVASSEDGIYFRKYVGNPIIDKFPEEGSKDFRDPKVWMHEGVWYMAVGSGKDGRANALLYKSADLTAWTYVGVMAKGLDGQGRIWNCPDFFRLDGMDVLLASPAVAPTERDIRTNIYMIGQMDYKTGRFTQVSDGDIDLGPDFYAPQTLIDGHGRVILFGWMDMWWNPMPTQAYGWTGAMTIPRVVTLDGNGKLAFTPAPELQQLRSNEQQFGAFRLSPEQTDLLNEVKGDCLEIEAIIHINESDANRFGFRLRRSADSSQETVITCCLMNGELIVDRTRSGVVDGGIRVIQSMPAANGKLKLQIFLDRSSLELFANDGQTTASFRIYPDPQSLGISVFAEGGCIQFESLAIWKLNAIW